VRVIAAVIAVPFVLSGCATAQPLPPIPTTTEVITFVVHNLDGNTAIDSPTAEQRPTDVGDIRIVNPTELDFAFAECVKGAGYADYSVDYFGTLILRGPTGTESEIERGVRHNCDFTHQLAFSSTALLSSREREFVYDYYRQWLVPCLALAGYPIHGAPSREEFINDWLQPGWWSPYDAIALEPGASGRESLRKQCPPLPPALETRLAGPKTDWTVQP
jgi:hypothetical protein